SRKPKNKDRAEVVNSSKDLFEIFVCNICQRAAVGAPRTLNDTAVDLSLSTRAEFRQRIPVRTAAIDPRTEFISRNKDARRKSTGDQENAHDQSSGREQLARISDPVRTLDQRHDGDAGFKSRKAQGELRKTEYSQNDDPGGARDLETTERSLCREQEG